MLPVSQQSDCFALQPRIQRPFAAPTRKQAYRNYSAVPLKTEYYPEMGVRILMGAVARTLAKYDKAMTPLLSYASAHYVRLFVSVKKGIKEADECLKRNGISLALFQLRR